MSGDGSGQRALTGGSWASPDWSPDARKIAFSGYEPPGQIFVMNADGTGQRSLTSDPGHKGDPDWSPDGSKIAMTYFGRPGNRGNERGWERPGRADRQRNRSRFRPKWSPDGTKIAFERLVGSSGEIFVMNADGSETNLTNSADDGSLPGHLTGRGSPSIDRRPCCGQLLVMNADGAKTPSSAPERRTRAAWSPDGSKIAFSSDLQRRADPKFRDQR